MKELLLILNYRRHSIKNTLKQINIIRLLSFIFVIGCFLTGSYYLFYRIFNYLTTVEIIGYVLMNKTLEIFFFVFFLMLLFSNVITSFSTFYNNRELNFLFTLPIKPTSIYLAKLLENSLYASWATLVVAFPLIVAYGICSRASLLYYPVSIISIFIYVIIPAAIASILIFFILSIFPQLRPRDVVFITIAFVLGLTSLYIKLENPELLKIFETENEKRLLEFAANLSTVGGSYLPSTWLSHILNNLKDLKPQGLFYLVLLLSVSISILILAFFCARLVYISSFIKAGEHSSRSLQRESMLSLYQKNKELSFLKKDVLLFLRNPTQWVQLAVFIILLLIYIFSLQRTQLFFPFPIWRTVVSFANFAYISFVLATLGVRFVFPTISLEKDGLWLILSSPFSLNKMLKIKYLFNLVVGIIIMESLVLIANSLIRIDPLIYILTPVFSLFVAASLISINLGMGCSYPQFDEDNPSKIAAGTGGILTALLSIAYVGIIIILLAAPTHNYLIARYFHQKVNLFLILLSFTAFLLITFFAIYLPLRMGMGILTKRDF